MDVLDPEERGGRRGWPLKELKHLAWVIAGVCGLFVGLTGRLVQYQLDGWALVPVELEERLMAGSGGMVAFAVGMLLLLQGRGQGGSRTPKPR